MPRRQSFRIARIAALVLLGVGLPAQSQARLAEMRDGKLQLPFLKQVAWKRDFVAAQAAATRRGQYIFAYFTRSDDRCQGSLSLECGVFAEPAFQEFCRKVVPLCNITTRVEGDPDQGLFRAKGGELFPYLVFMNAAGRVLYRVKGEKVSDFQAGLEALDQIVALQKRVASGDRKAPFELLHQQLILHHIAYPAAKAALKKVPRLSRAQRRILAPYLFESEVLHLVGKAGASSKARARLGEKFYRRQKRGEIPTRDARLPFWMCVLAYAELRKKPEVYELALDTLKQEFHGMEFPAQDRILLWLKTRHDK